MSLTLPSEAIKPAITASGKAPAEVADICRRMFNKPKFSNLTDLEQWTLIATLNPESTGPYGCSMAPF